MQKIGKKIGKVLLLFICCCLLVCGGFTGAALAQAQIVEIDEVHITAPDEVPGFEIGSWAFIDADGCPIVSYVLVDKTTGQQYLAVADYDLAKVVAQKGVSTLADLGVPSGFEDPVWAKNFEGQRIVPASYDGKPGVVTMVPISNQKADSPSPRYFQVPSNVNYVAAIF